MFYPGQKVVCVDDNIKTSYQFCVGPPNFTDSNMDGLQKGLIYTIRKVQHVLRINQIPVDEVLLYEITRCENFEMFSNKWCEIGFLSCRFRPLQNKETDISIFKRILTDADIYERV